LTVPHWPGMGAKPMFTCKIHGEQPWDGHLVCTRCGAAYTTKDETLSSHAPPRCLKCHERFMPLKGAKVGSHRYTAFPACALCFAEAPGGKPFQAVHDRGSPYCLGESCPHHGPMLKKLARRAKRFAHEVAKSS
jgi:hypothetical protein